MYANEGKDKKSFTTGDSLTKENYCIKKVDLSKSEFTSAKMKHVYISSGFAK